MFLSGEEPGLYNWLYNDTEGGSQRYDFTFRVSLQKIVAVRIQRLRILKVFKEDSPSGQTVFQGKVCVVRGSQLAKEIRFGVQKTILHRQVEVEHGLFKFMFFR